MTRSEKRRRKSVVIGHLRGEANRLGVKFRAQSGGQGRTLVYIGNNPPITVGEDGKVEGQ